MSREKISNVVAALRPLQIDFGELVNEINDLWKQLQAVERTSLEGKEQVATLIRLNLTDSIEKMQKILSTLSGHIFSLQSVLPLPRQLRLSVTFESDLDYLLHHLQDVREECELQLMELSEAMDTEEIKQALKERNLYEENYRLVTSIRRLRTDLTL